MIHPTLGRDAGWANPVNSARRRLLTRFALAVGAAGALPGAWALSALEALSAGQAADGVRAALESGARFAVAQLGRADGFWGNPQARIPLPPALEQAAKLLQSLGQGAKVDELRLAMNRAAERAVPAGQEVLLQAVHALTVQDAKAILTGGDTSVTDFFSARTRQPLSVKFLPIVQDATQKVDLAGKYDQLAGKAAALGLLKGDDVHLANFVTGKTLDALYHLVAEQEKTIRRDPMAAGSAVLQKVFGALR
jgi:hypothetical protein